MEQGGAVREVHIQHEGRPDPQTCSEIAMCLNSGNFSKFTSHLQVSAFCLLLLKIFNECHVFFLGFMCNLPSECRKEDENKSLFSFECIRIRLELYV